MLVDVVLVGLVVGLMSSLLGLGGGIVIFPVLSIYLGFSHHDAIATSKLTICLVTASNVWRFQLKKFMNWPAALYIALFAGLISYGAGLTIPYLNDAILLLLFIVFLIIVIIKTLRLQPKDPLLSPKKRSKWAQALKIGIITGVISGLTGVGGGSIATPLLLDTPGIRNDRVVPIANGIMLFTSALAVAAFMQAPLQTAAFWQVGYVHFDTAFFIFLSSIPTTYLGAKFQHKMSLHWRKILLSFFLIIILIRMLIRLLNFWA